MLIISADIFVEKDNKMYCKPYSFTSLSQFWELADNVTLLGIKKDNYDISGWKEVPNHVSCIAINNIIQLSVFKNKSLANHIKSVAAKHSVIYLRMPDKKNYQVFKIISEIAPVFCEFHGDWEEAFNIQRLNKVGFKDKFKGLIAIYRASKAKQAYYKILRKSIFNLTIGPKLARDYGMLDVSSAPCLATTNHIVSEKDIVDLGMINTSRGACLKLIYIGELQTRKGLIYLLGALKDLKTNKINFHLTVVGDGYLMASLKSFVEDNNLIADVSFLGAIYERSKLDYLLLKSDVFVLPSIAAEGVPRVLQEAQSKACAIIATDIGSTYWQLEKEGGLLIKPKCKNSIVDAIIRLAMDPIYLQSMKEGAVVRAGFFAYEKQKQEIQSFVKDNLTKRNIKLSKLNQ